MGFLVSRGWTRAMQLAGAGLFLICCAAVMAYISGYGRSGIVSLSALAPNPHEDRVGLVQVTGVAYACIIGSLVAAIRTAFAGARAHAEKSSDI